MSLPTLVSIANALEVSLDEIIYDSLVKNKHIIDDLISDCTSDEMSAVIDIVKTTLKILRKNKN